MSIFDLISLLGGLAMFLYGMRLMGDGLKEGSSGTLKKALEKLTSTPIRAFLLGLAMTAIIQSSTATIVITSGLVGAGILSLRQSLGIVIGANVGTTVTGQIIRLLDVNAEGTSLLRLFQPSTLAPLALIAGIVIIMYRGNKGPGTAGQILIGFGILFSGLLNMTDAVSTLTQSGFIERLFSRLGDNPVLGYLTGAGVAFVLQSSSASIGILQAFSTSGQLTFGAIYAVLVGIYLGDCVTTAIVCNIGASPEAKRVGVVNILYNLCKSLLILLVVNLLHFSGALNGLWDRVLDSGGIANTNTLFNLGCALALFPFLRVFERWSYRPVKEPRVPVPEEKDAMADALSPAFFSTPALALGRCYEALLAMFEVGRNNVDSAFDGIAQYNAETLDAIAQAEERVDNMADAISNYLIQLSAHLTASYHIEILNHYFTAVTEFERLSDHAMRLSEIAADMHKNKAQFSEYAQAEIGVLRGLLDTILDYSRAAFEKRDVDAARHIEPLEEVVDDMVQAVKERHLERLRQGTCTFFAGIEYLDLLTEVERISDTCSNIGMATIARATPELAHQVHEYASMLHAGGDPEFNREYQQAHDDYFARLTRGTAQK